MKFSTYVSSLEDLQRCVRAPGVDEVLIEPALLARQGRLSTQEAETLAQQARTLGLRPILVWDILMPQDVMRSVCARLEAWELTHFEAVRVCDPGAAAWLMQTHPTMPLQLSVEAGSHNEEALQGWCEIFAPTLERLSLSIELPEDKLSSLASRLPVPCEILGLGPILLFYSPRSLLRSHLLAENPEVTKEMEQNSPENSLLVAITSASQFNQKPFVTVESAHGTMMFLDKDQYVLDRLENLGGAGLERFRLDLRHLDHAGGGAPQLEEICTLAHEDPAALRRRWPRKTRAPFFRANKTTAQFSRMKSPLHAQRDRSCLAQLLAGENGNFVVFYTLRAASICSATHLVLPSGEELELPESLHFRDLDGNTLTSFEAEQIVVSDWIKKACAGALLRAV